MIWFQKFSVDDLNGKTNRNMSEFLDIRYEQVGDDFLSASMPVDEKTKQPFGLLHGGASCVLAETVGSVASNCCLDPQKEYAVGLEINANHLRAETDGRVLATARAFHLGKKTHVWDIQITNSKGKLVCVSRLTMAILEKTKS